MKKLGFNLILIGMIAAGKETQANILKKKYALKFIESGVYVRNLLKEKSRDGNRARETSGKGKPLLTSMLQKFLMREIQNKPKNKDILFVGTPRLKPEAQLVKKILNAQNQDFFGLYITLPDKEVYKRSIKRSTGNMKTIYKVFDTKKLIGIRIKWHKDQVRKTVKYLKSLNKLKIINGNQPISKVTKDIVKAIETYKKERK